MGGHVDHATIEATKFGRNIVGFNGEFLDVVKGWEECNLTRLGLHRRDSVVEILVRPRAPAVDAR